MDDRLLTKRVRAYYDGIENLIFNYYKSHFLITKRKVISDDGERKKNLNLINKARIDRDFYKNMFIQNFEELGKYLGFTSSGRSVFYVKFYIDGEKYILESEGAIMLYLFGENVNAGPRTPILGSDKDYQLTEYEIRIIREFLENLRLYWKDNFTRRKFFRGNLKSNIDFRILVEYPKI
ncbi:MAG: hypothetical protein ACFFDF_09365 [Candidatus Odinarchaeota archaeon]